MLSSKESVLRKSSLTSLKKLIQAASENDRHQSKEVHQWKQVHQCVLSTATFPGKECTSDLSMSVFGTSINTFDSILSC